MNGRKQVVIVLLQAGIDVTLHNDRSMTHIFPMYHVYIFGSGTDWILLLILFLFFFLLVWLPSKEAYDYIV